jgi:hypothetical protein
MNDIDAESYSMALITVVIIVMIICAFVIECC